MFCDYSSVNLIFALTYGSWISISVDSHGKDEEEIVLLLLRILFNLP